MLLFVIRGSISQKGKKEAHRWSRNSTVVKGFFFMGSPLKLAVNVFDVNVGFHTRFVFWGDYVLEAVNMC